MKLSTPIYRLKRKAKLLSRKNVIPLHLALDRVAADEGFKSWSLLATQTSGALSISDLFTRLTPGDLVLVGARPGQGKTLLSLQLAVEAMKTGRRAAFFTLEYTARDALDRLRAIGVDPASYEGLFAFDNSDAICADYIIREMANAPRGALAIIDYLQLLDQKREHPALMDQVRALKSFARSSGAILVFLSQIARAYDPATKPFPDLEDVRLPNPLDLSLFDKSCFLNKGEIQFRSAA